MRFRLKFPNAEDIRFPHSQSSELPPVTIALTIKADVKHARDSYAPISPDILCAVCVWLADDEFSGGGKYGRF
jgi:hypothetical protein